MDEVNNFHSNAFLLFLSSLPQYQAEYLIFRKWPIEQRATFGLRVFAHVEGKRNLNPTSKRDSVASLTSDFQNGGFE